MWPCRCNDEHPRTKPSSGQSVASRRPLNLDIRAGAPVPRFGARCVEPSLLVSENRRRRRHRVDKKYEVFVQ